MKVKGYIAISILITIIFGCFLTVEYHSLKKSLLNERVKVENLLHKSINYTPYSEDGNSFNGLCSYINSMLLYSFSKVGGLAPYEWALLDVKNDQLVYFSDSSCYTELVKSPYQYFVYDELSGTPDSSYSFFVYFPQENQYILAQLSEAIYSSLFVSTTIFMVYVLTIFMLIRNVRRNMRKIEYIKGMTHEINTPIAGIMIATEGLTDKIYPPNEEQKEIYYNMFTEGSIKVKRLVGQILRQAKSDSFKLKLEIGIVDINKPIHAQSKNLLLQAQNKGGSISLDLKSTNYIKGDEFYLSDIIANLIENAIKYTPENPLIRIYTLDTSKGVEIRIQDNGIGISPENQKRIFKSGFRVKSKEKTEVKGHGIGLGFVVKVVKLHKGFIQVESEEGKGATFIVRL